MHVWWTMPYLMIYIIMSPICRRLKPHFLFYEVVLVISGELFHANTVQYWKLACARVVDDAFVSEWKHAAAKLVFLPSFSWTLTCSHSKGDQVNTFNTIPVQHSKLSHGYTRIDLRKVARDTRPIYYYCSSTAQHSK